ncbi:MAG: molybdopterin-dependent oxidoreductase, partial [Candidatus Eremiobacteraeota bacterium]|nr:molybdopterin-dependent oxidoreductase [Candidatus Eremiobacteraeota bacterium]
MTNHWPDIKNADLILINGANPAEAHPVGFQWFMRAKLDPARGPGKGGGAKIVHADPRFSRTSAVSDMYVRIRTGTDVAYFGGLINYVLQNDKQHQDYVAHYTNASFIVKDTYGFKDGLFTGYDPKTRTYDTKAWNYDTGPDGFAHRDMTLQNPRCVFQLMKAHYSRYTPEMVQSITGIPKDDFLKIAQMVGEMGRPDKVMTIVYAVGLTQHTTGAQLIRSGAVLQLLLGNMGRPGGGMNAERGHANIQANTDHAISWEILPGYLKIPQPGTTGIDDYVKKNAPKKFDPNSWNFFGTNYKKFLVSLLKAWYGPTATASNDYAFAYIPKPAGNSSWMSIFDSALKGKMQGLLLSGMTATSIGPDSNQVLQALSKLKWLVVMDAFPTTSSEFWHGPGMTPASVQTEVFMLPTTHWIEKDGSFVNSGRWMQWKDQVLPPQGDARHDHWITAELFQRVKALYTKNGGKFPDPLMHLTMDYKDPRKPTLDEIALEINGKYVATGKQVATFAKLADDGSTSAGDWIYTGSYTDKGNMSKRRNGVQDPAKNDPTGMGFYPQWAWSWPLNR